MNGPGPFETSTGREIARAAWKLMNECVRDQGGQGGVVGNLGMFCGFASLSVPRKFCRIVGSLSYVASRGEKIARDHYALL